MLPNNALETDVENLGRKAHIESENNRSSNYLELNTPNTPSETPARCEIADALSFQLNAYKVVPHEVYSTCYSMNEPTAKSSSQIDGPPMSRNQRRPYTPVLHRTHIRARM